MRDTLVDEGESPFDSVVHEEVRARVEEELRQISEPYRTTVILRDLEEMSYEEIAEITQVSLGTVKSRLTRGREALRKRLTGYVVENARTTRFAGSRGDQGRQTGCADFRDRGGTMTCAQARPLFSPYLDGAVTGKQMRELSQHLESCESLQPALRFAAADAATAGPRRSAQGAG